jgi:ABC-2 type transport system permease protein
MAIEALGYRPWRGVRRSQLLRFWPIARKGLYLVFKKRVFRVFLVLGLLNFLFLSAVIYLQAQVEGKIGSRMFPRMREAFPFTGAGEAYQDFIYRQGMVVMMMLGLGGGLLVGNDFRSNALPFYLSKPIGKVHYFLGKLAAGAVLAGLLTLAPALALFVQYGAFTESFAYYTENLRLLGAIAAYGGLVSVSSALFILAVASVFKRTVPIILVWGGLFVLLPATVEIIRNIYQDRGYPEPWRWALLDLWADQRWLARSLFGIHQEVYAERWPYAALVLGGAALISLVVFWRRIAAYQVVR